MIDKPYGHFDESVFVNAFLVTVLSNVISL